MEAAGVRGWRRPSVAGGGLPWLEAAGGRVCSLGGGGRRELPQLATGEEKGRGMAGAGGGGSEEGRCGRTATWELHLGGGGRWRRRRLTWELTVEEEDGGK